MSIEKKTFLERVSLRSGEVLPHPVTFSLKSGVMSDISVSTQAGDIFGEKRISSATLIRAISFLPVALE